MDARKYGSLKTMLLHHIVMVWMALCICFPLTGQSFAAQPQVFDFETLVDDKTGEQLPNAQITVTRGKSKVIEVNRDIADVLVADPSVIEVGALKNNRLYIIGAALGDTNVMIFDGQGNPIQQLDVHVRVDERTLKNTLSKLFPNESINAKTVNDDVVLTGDVSSPAAAARIAEVAARFTGTEETIVNMMGVQGEQQVMIKVKVLEVARSVLNELGMDTDISQTNADGSSFNLATTGAFGMTVSPSLAAGTLAWNNSGIGDITSVFNALERDGLVSTLAEPNLTAISGQNARFLAGGEFPIPSQRDNNGNITYEYRPFGVALAFKPIVMDADRINLQVSTEVSDVSDEFTLSFPGITVPGFDVRRAETNVELASGGTLMMAGLIESKSLDRLNRLPGVKDIPILGALSNSESFNRNESELVIMITAYLVKPFADKEEAAERVAEVKTSPLKQAVLANLRRNHGDFRALNAVKEQPIGYLMD